MEKIILIQNNTVVTVVLNQLQVLDFNLTYCGLKLRALLKTTFYLIQV